MVRAQLKKSLLGGVLKTYLLNGDDIAPQISFTALMAGHIRLRNVRFVPDLVQGSLASYLPLCLEVESCVVKEMEVSLNWKHLSSKPVVMTISEITVEFIVHNTATAHADAAEEEKRFWKMQAGRVLGDQATLAALCAAGALPPTLTDRVVQGLNVEIEKVTCRLRRPDSTVLEAFLELHGLRFGPVSETFEWTKNLEKTQANVESLKEVQLFSRFDVQSISLRTVSGDGEIRAGPLSMKGFYKMPGRLPLVAPFPCTTRIDADLGTITISGPEDKLLVIMKIANDMQQSLTLLEKLDELSELEECSPNQRFYTAKQTSDFDDLAGKAFCAGDPDEDDDAGEMDYIRSEVKERQDLRWHAPPGRKLTENSTIDCMLQQRRRATVEIETFFQLGVRSSCDEGSLQAALAADMALRERFATAAEFHPGKAALSVPEEAVYRSSVRAKKFLVDLILPEGRVTVEVDELNFIGDTIMPLFSEARAWCAKLFDIPLASSPDVTYGAMVQNVTVQALGMAFFAGEQIRYSNLASTSSSSFCSEQAAAEEEDDCGFDDETVIVRLSKGSMPSLSMRKRGPGNPLCCEGFKLEPMDVTTVGLRLRAGPGLDALIAWSSRISSALPQVPLGAAPTVPASCYHLRFLDSVFVQKPPAESVLCDGRWPIKVTVPLIEAKTVSSLFELPKVINAALHTDSQIDAREWWQPAKAPAHEGASLHVATRQAAGVQSRLVRLEKEVEYLKHEQAASNQREEKLKNEVERLRRRRQSASSSLSDFSDACISCMNGIRKVASSALNACLEDTSCEKKSALA